MNKKIIALIILLIIGTAAGFVIYKLDNSESKIEEQNNIAFIDNETISNNITNDNNIENSEENIQNKGDEEMENRRLFILLTLGKHISIL